jgi:hypothetical protein
MRRMERDTSCYHRHVSVLKEGREGRRRTVQTFAQAPSSSPPPDRSAAEKDPFRGYANRKKK